MLRSEDAQNTVLCKNGESVMLWASCEIDVSEGVGAATLWVLRLLNNTAEDGVMAPFR